jgi:two-component system response regulator
MITREIAVVGPEQTSGESGHAFGKSPIAGSKSRVAHVLIVDDSAYDALLMENAFDEAELPHSIASVRDGEEAIRYLKSEPPFSNEPLPNLILLDLNMPRVDGFEVLAWVRSDSRCQSIPIVVMSSSIQREDEVRARTLGASEYREKTGDLDELRRFVLELHSRWMEKT